MTFKKKRSYPESITCRNYLTWLKLQHPNVRNHLIKIDNEGSSNRAVAISLGLHPKASDYFIAWPTKRFHGLWLEVKADNWTPNSKQRIEHANGQKAFGEKMMKRGYQFAFCVGFQECVKATNDYLKTI